jgi:hypothetical protein
MQGTMYGAEVDAQRKREADRDNNDSTSVFFFFVGGQVKQLLAFFSFFSPT